MAFPPSSSSFHYGFTYDVFLSFRAQDTRSGFAGNLWKALNDRKIRTFIDDEELQKREEFTPSLLKAIEESRIAIVVLSINYASSSFCLDELVTIIECSKAKGRLVLPIFYDVDPSHVRHQTGCYGEAIAKHEERFQNNKEKYIDNMERLQKWKNALQQVANLSGGFHFKNGNDFEPAFIQMIMKEVSKKINRDPLHVADYPVGLESRLQEVRSLLELQSNEVLMVGIYGVGGIGKSTLARAVYNIIADQFEGLCFLHNVRESSAKFGLQHLQEKLISKTIGLNIKFEDVSEEIPIIKQRLHRKKVLLILNDVDSLEQLEALVGGRDWFGFGSRVIITTRDKHLLTFHGVERTYEVQELNHRDALQLLSYQVFKQPNVDTTFEELLNRAVTYASGLPLALEVMGSNLFGKNKEEWKSILDRYERIPHKEIQKILKISFDALAEDEQSVFLDIACCFKGHELTEVQDILHAHYGHEMNYHIEVLINKSLISILDGKVTLHPLIEDMGREIVRQESPIEPGKRSRLWFHEDIVQVLEENKGTSQTEIIHLDSPLIDDKKVIEWDGDAFKKMTNLKTLIIKSGHFSTGPNDFPSSLRVLEWLRYPSPALPPNFEPTKVYKCRVKISQGVTEVPQSVPPPQTLDIVPYAPPNSQGFTALANVTLNELRPSICSLPWLMGYPYPALPPNFEPTKVYKCRIPEVPPNSQRVTEVPQSVPPPQTLDIVPYVPPPISHWDTYEVLQKWQSVYQSRTTWIGVGLMSSVVGLPCNALSPSFTCLIGGWNAFRIILYVVFCLAILAAICFEKLIKWLDEKLSSLIKWLDEKLSSLFNRHPWLKGKQSSLFNRYLWLKGKLSSLFEACLPFIQDPRFKKFEKFVFYMLTFVYATRYEKCLDGKPEILSMVSNAALTLVSLSLSKLINHRGCEKGIFMYFLGCFAEQLYTIHWKLIFVVIFFGFPLFAMHSSPDS